MTSKTGYGQSVRSQPKFLVGMHCAAAVVLDLIH